MNLYPYLFVLEILDERFLTPPFSQLNYRDIYAKQVNYSCSTYTLYKICGCIHHSLLWVGLEPTQPHTQHIIGKALEPYSIRYLSAISKLSTALPLLGFQPEKTFQKLFLSKHLCRHAETPFSSQLTYAWKYVRSSLMSCRTMRHRLSTSLESPSPCSITNLMAETV